jgi:ornithine cyclodeaminase
VYDIETQFPLVRVSATAASNVQDVQACLKRASIVICATPSTEALFDSSYIQGGTHIILIGSYKPTMREVDNALIRRAIPVVVDSISACLEEAGEIISAGLDKVHLVEIGELVRRAGDGQRHPVKNSVTVFKSVGLGVQDVAIASAVVKKAEEMKVGLVYS